MRDLSDIKVGDRVRRLLSEVVPMDLWVVKIDEKLIHCALTPDETDPGWIWTFDVTYGIEEDALFGWGVGTGITGSRLIGILEDGDEPIPEPNPDGFNERREAWKASRR